jgi:carbon-monoxide dehydrogenase large subunit
MLGISPARVLVNNQLDSFSSPFLGHSGVYSNKFNDVDLGAVIKATEKIRNKMLRISAHALQTDIADLKFKDGAICARREPSKQITFQEIASLAYKRISLLPHEMEPGLKEIAYYRNPAAKIPRKEDFTVQLTHANSIHIAAVRVDVETGAVAFLKYVIVHDCGNILNPAIVDGMTIGSTVHAIGAMFLEEFVYDDDGQLKSSTFMDYLKPVANGLPRFEIGHVCSPCPTTLLGTKSAGEGGAIGSLAAVANAIEDALVPFDVKVRSLPITPEKIVRAVRQTKEI